MNRIETPYLNGAVRSAYHTASNLKTSPVGTENIEAPEKSSFPNMVKEASEKALNTVRYADQAMQSGMRDEISIQEVIQATMEAEATIKTVINIRNKAVEPYQ